MWFPPKDLVERFIQTSQLVYGEALLVRILCGSPTSHNLYPVLVDGVVSWVEEQKVPAILITQRRFIPMSAKVCLEVDSSFWSFGSRAAILDFLLKRGLSIREGSDPTPQETYLRLYSTEGRGSLMHKGPPKH